MFYYIQTFCVWEQRLVRMFAFGEGTGVEVELVIVIFGKVYNTYKYL